MRAIKTQLSVGLVLSLVVLFFLQWLLVSASIRALAEHYVVSRLEHDSESVLAALSFDAKGVASIDDTRINQIYKRPFSGHYYQLAMESQLLLSRSLWDQDLPPVTLTPGAHTVVHHAGPQRQDLLIRSAGYRKKQHALTISIAEDLSPIDAGLRGFHWRYGAVSLGALLLLLIIQYRLVRIGLEPLERARQELQGLERGELQALGTDAPEEVRPLVLQINQLLEILSARLARSRHALGNLSHALKTPLTLLNQLADDDRLRAHPELRDALRAQLDTMRGITERELRRARLAGAARIGERVDMNVELAALIDTLRRLHRDKALDFEVRATGETTSCCDREDLLELLGNLLDNACKWGRSQVRVTVESGNGLLVRIEDDGPGCAPAQLEALTQRGTRMDEQTAGHGLGLSIVQEIVAQYGGTLQFGVSQALGGMQVEIRL